MAKQIHETSDTSVKLCTLADSYLFIFGNIFALVTIANDLLPGVES